ncbi:hypothetical protein PVT67_11200 [Gallaecimonas kandeliae]|uniref:hypothetical protein n=1 Tax=Gallaecimonas kandeliae TaxID=3029055 RepID=UPI002649DC99|nr:hypothetical protein [Gallaecimonas kandeliae]WKE64257.1 hypothetical protein PVT67_11200 [Gallaecimonas kandeliae]
MERPIALIPLLLAFSLPAMAASLDISKLVGIWGNSEDGGKTFWGYDQYLADGSTKSWGTVPNSEFSYEIEGRYEIKEKFGTLSCVTVTKTSAPALVPVGSRICDTLIDINDKTFVFKSDEGEVTTLYRQSQ